MSQRTFNWPINPTTVSSGPIQFLKDGASTTVSQDTVTPSNSTPLPVSIFNSSGPIGLALDFGASSAALRVASLLGNSSGVADFGSGSISAQTLRTGIASDQFLYISRLQGATGAAVPSYAQLMAANDPSNNLRAVSVDGNGYVNTNIQSSVTIPVSQSGSWVVNQDVINNGSITSTQSVSIAVNGLATAGIQVTGTWTGTLAVEGSVDGTNYNSTTAAFLANGQLVSNITSNAVYQANLSGLVGFRIRGNTIGSGTAVVYIRGNSTTSMIMLDNSLPSGSAIIGKVGIDQTTPGTTNGVVVNSSALPSGASTSALQTTGNSYLSTIATNSSKSSINTSGAYDEITNLTTSAQTLTAPANAVGFVLESLSDNTANIRYKIGATATTSSGMRLEPGRDSGYVPCGASVSVVTETGSAQTVTIQWVVQ